MGIRRILGVIAVASLGAVIPGLAANTSAQQPATSAVRLCVERVREIERHGDERNFNFTMKVRGFVTTEGDGFWIAAEDGSGAFYVQRGGGARAKPGGELSSTRTFGVSNVSNYPLTYSLLRTGANSMPDYKETEARSSRVGRPGKPGHMIDFENEAKGSVITSSPACVVDIDASGYPDTSECEC